VVWCVLVWCGVCVGVGWFQGLVSVYKKCSQRVWISYLQWNSSQPLEEGAHCCMRDISIPSIEDIILINAHQWHAPLKQVLTMRQQALARSSLTPCTASPLVPSLHSSFPQRSHDQSSVHLLLLTAGRC